MSNKAALISGASSGIGRAAALRLADAGFDVYAGVRNEQAAEALRAASAGRLKPIFLDIADPGSIDKAIHELEQPLAANGLAALINNAGISVTGAIEYLPMEEWQRQFDVNFFGHIDLTRRLLGAIRRARGRVVFTSSVGGFSATAMLGPYNASKFAIEGLADSLRQEVAPFGVTVSIVQPGATRTGMLDAVDATAARARSYLGEDGGEIYRATSDAVLDAFKRMSGAAADPELVAKAIEHAVTSPKPKTRYRVGMDTRMQAIFSWFLSDGLMDRLKRSFLKTPGP